jgi:O-antigen ligase
MPYGSGPVIRQAMQHATPWQRNLIGVAMVVLGVVLVLVGHVAGGLLAVAGVLLLFRMIRYRLPRRRGAAATPTQEGAQP